MDKSLFIKLFQRFGVRPGWYGWYLHLYKLSLRGMGILNSEGSQATGEDWLFGYLQKANVPIGTVCDVGANEGGYTTEMRRFFPNATYHCFEPNPETYELLAATAKKFTTMHTYRLALGKIPETVKLYDFADDAPLKHTQPTATMASLYKPVIEEYHQQRAKAYKVKVVTLDSWSKKKKIGEIDYLKIDTEGHELAVLQGSTKLLQHNMIHFIQFEFNEMHSYSHTFLRDIMQLLSGYTLFRLLPRGFVSLNPYRPLTHELFGFQNIIAVGTKYRALFG
jgi:FkbM family methyltransferase